MTIAHEYFSRVLSPWVSGVDNPVPRWVEELARPADGLAVDVGCGPGVLTCYLAQHFSRVIAIDRDRTMVETTDELLQNLRRQGAQLGEIELRHADWYDCDDVRSADLVCAINSMLEVDPGRRAQMLSQLRKTLQSWLGQTQPGREPTLLAVFPSMEAQIHLLRLYFARLTEQGLEPEEVMGFMESEFHIAHHFDALAGTFSSQDESVQKFVYQLELGWELADAGFEVEELSPLKYPWEVCRQVDAGYFPGEIELFDWLVKARPLTPG